MTILGRLLRLQPGHVRECLFTPLDIMKQRGYVPSAMISCYRALHRVYSCWFALRLSGRADSNTAVGALFGGGDTMFQCRTFKRVRCLRGRVNSAIRACSSRRADRKRAGRRSHRPWEVGPAWKPCSFPDGQGQLRQNAQDGVPGLLS